MSISVGKIVLYCGTYCVAQFLFLCLLMVFAIPTGLLLSPTLKLSVHCVLTGIGVYGMIVISTALTHVFFANEAQKIAPGQQRIFFILLVIASFWICALLVGFVLCFLPKTPDSPLLFDAASLWSLDMGGLFILCTLMSLNVLDFMNENIQKKSLKSYLFFPIRIFRSCFQRFPGGNLILFNVITVASLFVGVFSVLL